MGKETATVVFQAPSKKISVDLEIPLNISANQLVTALNEGYDLNIDTTDMKNCFFRAERPVALLRGNRTLAEFGVRDGTVIIF